MGRHPATLLACATGALVAVGWYMRRRKRSIRCRAIKLTYLDAKGSGEPIRLALHIGGVHFTDCRVTYPEIAALRKSGYLKYGQVPALEIDGQVHAQSQALLRWVGRETGLYPEEFQLQIDEIEEAIVDVKYILRPAWYGSALGRSPITGQPLLLLTESQQTACMDALNNEILPTRIAQLEKQLACHLVGPFLCGPCITIADLSLYVFFSGLQDGSEVPPGISRSLLDDCPTILGLLKQVGAHPKVDDWNRNHCGVIHRDKPTGVNSTVNAF